MNPELNDFARLTEDSKKYPVEYSVKGWKTGRLHDVEN